MSLDILKSTQVSHYRSFKIASLTLLLGFSTHNALAQSRNSYNHEVKGFNITFTDGATVDVAKTFGFKTVTGTAINPFKLNFVGFGDFTLNSVRSFALLYNNSNPATVAPTLQNTVATGNVIAKKGNSNGGQKPWERDTLSQVYSWEAPGANGTLKNAQWSSLDLGAANPNSSTPTGGSATGQFSTGNIFKLTNSGAYTGTLTFGFDVSIQSNSDTVRNPFSGGIGAGSWGVRDTINGRSVFTQTGRVYQTFGQDGFPPSGNPVPEPAFYQMSALLGMGLMCVWRRRKKA